MATSLVAVAGPAQAGAVAAGPAASSVSTASNPGPSTLPPADDLLLAPGLEGSAKAPSLTAQKDLADTQKRTQASAQRSLTAVTPAALGSFTLSADTPQLSVAPSLRPYARVSAAPLGAGTRDSTGVPMFRIGTRLFDHPVRQAQDGILALESYRISHDPRQLAQARLDAQRLFNRRVVRAGAYFFPYPFDFALHGAAVNLIHAPWYSGMAQGLALSLFSRLADVPGQAAWRSSAAATFTSLLMPPVPTNTRLPFVSWVDSARHLWIDEYARLPLSKADRTFNGHIFAVYGVWDYYFSTRDARAVQMFKGALSTVRFHVGRGWRTSFWISHYCLTHGRQDSKYHGIHTRQLNLLYTLTASTSWAIWSDLFRDDYPTAAMNGSVRFPAGRTLGYTFNAAGQPLTSRALTLNSTSKAPTSQRARIKGRAYYYLITAGSLKGYRVQERPTVYRPGLILATGYATSRPAVLAIGRQTGWTLTAAGLRAGARTITVSQRTVVSFDRSGWIDGASYVRVTNGTLASRWVRTAGMTMR
jgi:hypothetical protein